MPWRCMTSLKIVVVMLAKEAPAIFCPLRSASDLNWGWLIHLVRIAVIRAADDLQFAPACRRDQAEMSTRSCQVYGSGKKRLDREVGLHVGHFALDILSLQKYLLPRYN